MPSIVVLNPALAPVPVISTDTIWPASVDTKVADVNLLFKSATLVALPV